MKIHCTSTWLVLGVSVCIGIAATAARAAEAKGLRLVPYPKQVALGDGTFDLQRPLVLERAQGVADTEIALIAAEMQRAGLPAPKLATAAIDGIWLRLTAGPTAALPPCRFRDGAGNEDYQLRVEREAITGCGRGPTGLFYAAQTLCQLIRANRDGTKLPCLAIEDWPSLRWRCTQDDLTRGPSSTLATLQRGVELGASLKLNMFTYYMEYQYAFAKHPDIGPPDGSLEPAELKALVSHAQKYHTEVLGNQQSFGHFDRILRKDPYKDLGENSGVLSPVKEGTYQLLDDMYSEVCPLLPFEMFNVCCDETWGLGEGPSKELAQQIGPGGVYVQHIRRVHDLLQTKYRKRMMMWGDIILQHPDKLDQIPKDTVMLTWGYGPRASFEDQILPFKNSGYEFFVCPGISNWSRILPDFGVATTNIGNFVRDGAKLGAIGMLNTDWEDDGEALQGYRWHGHAWAPSAPGMPRPRRRRISTAASAASCLASRATILARRSSCWPRRISCRGCKACRTSGSGNRISSPTAARPRSRNRPQRLLELGPAGDRAPGGLPKGSHGERRSAGCVSARCPADGVDRARGCRMGSRRPNVTRKRATSRLRDALPAVGGNRKAGPGQPKCPRIAGPRVRAVVAG